MEPWLVLIGVERMQVDIRDIAISYMNGQLSGLLLKFYANVCHINVAKMSYICASYMSSEDVTRLHYTCGVSISSSMTRRNREDSEPREDAE